MVDVILFLLPKALAAGLVWEAVSTYRRALRKGYAEACHYWWIGFALYNFAFYVTWGWLQQAQWFLTWFCLGGFLASMAISIYQDTQKDKKRKTAWKAAKTEIDAQMEALVTEIAKQTQERNEIISALDLIESWQALPNEEFVARQSEIEASLLSMEMRLP